MIDRTSMLSSVPADLFSGAVDIPVPVSEDAPIDDASPVDDTPGVDDTPVDAAPVDDAPPVDDAQPVDAAPVPPAPDAATTPEEMEEGVQKFKDSSGKYKYRLEENRYRNFHDSYKLVRDAADLIGEPLTADGLTLRNNAYLAQERLFDHLTSGEPERQADVLNFMLQEMKTAQADGETGVDPTVPFAETVYTTLRDQAPDAYAHLRLQAARDLVGEMFETAAGAKNPQLFSAAQHFAATLAGIGPKPADMTDAQYATHIREVTGRANIPFHTMQEMDGLVRGEDPMAAMARENAELKARLNGNNGNTGAERFRQWSTSHAQEVNAAIYNDTVKPALASVEGSWKNFPDDYQRLVVEPLNREITKIVGADQALDQQVRDLNARAQRATSESVRQQIGEQIKQLVVNRARLATEKAKGPILKFAAEALKGRSAQTNERRAAAQTRTAPSGTGTPVRQSVLPEVGQFKNNVYDSGAAMKQALAVLNAGR